MRNSFNTASFSEVVHEIRTNAAEGLFRYVDRARYSPLRGLTAELGPAMFGSVKSARRWCFDVRDPFVPDVEPTAGEPTPVDLALTGIGSCALITLVGGGSAKGFVFDSAQAVISCDRGAEGAPVRIDFEIDGEVDDEQIAGLVRQVQECSPNFVTLSAPVPVDWVLSTGTEPAASGTSAVHERSTGVRAHQGARRIRWLSGMQSESFGRSPSDAPPLRVDNPKQCAGVDWGPNPQEYLMMGLAAEVAAYLGTHSPSRLGRDVVWDVTARCTEDASGLLRADPNAVVQLQDVTCSVSMSSPPAAGDERACAELVDEAVSASYIGWLISEPQAVEISTRRPPHPAPTG